jgi:hypothetical protein
MEAMSIPSFDYLNEPFRDSEEAQGFGNMPDGTYRCKVDTVEIKESQNKPGSYYLNWQLVIDGTPDYAGRYLFHTNNLPDGMDLEKTRQQLGFLKHDLAMCGVNIKHPQFNLNDFLHNHLAKLLDRPVMVQAKTKTDKNTSKDRQNTYFQEAKSGVAGVAGATGPAGVGAAASANPIAVAPAEEAFDPFQDQ